MTRILLVDDEANIRMMIRLALQPKKYIVDMAFDGPEGLQKFGDGFNWDLVLLDHRMPGMEGLDVLREMRRRNPAARVILITAFGTLDLVTDAMEAGATQFLRKPFTLETLRSAVQAALTRPAMPPKFDPVPFYPEPEASENPRPLTFSSLTVNGFRIEFQPSSGLKTGEDTLYTFMVTNPEQDESPCTVLLPDYIRGLVKAYTNRENYPGGDRFWQALCEEALTNYLWQNAEVPPQGVLRLEELPNYLRRFVDAVLERRR